MTDHPPPWTPPQAKAPAGALKARPLPPPMVAPHPPTRLERLFLEWRLPQRSPSALLLGGVGAAALVGVITLGDFVDEGFLGVNVLITALAVAAVVLPAAWSAGRVVKDGRYNRTGALFCLLVLALVVTPAIRDAEWVVGLSLLLTLPLVSYAMVGGRTWTGLIGGGMMLPAAAARMVPWVARGLSAGAKAGRGQTLTVARTALIVLLLLMVFGGLFAGADAAFRDFAERLVPEVAPAPIIGKIVVGAGTAVLALALAFLVLAPPPLRVLATDRPPAVGRWTWAVPIGALNLLFLAFCAVQASVLLATDKDKLLASTGLTYAEYARQGFFQLVIATVLVLAVVAFAVRCAPVDSSADRTLVRALLGALCVLTLVVVAVALRRLYLYEESYGWTRLRLWVHAFELWLGLVIVLIAAAGLKLKASWLPRAIAATGAAALLGLVAINPDAFIAERNVARFESTGKIDTAYLRELSADAVPALSRLPEPQRSCTLREFSASADPASRAGRVVRERSVWSANLSRHYARQVLERRSVQYPPNC